jgi:hypothetical protein
MTICDACFSQPATVDHLDFAVGEARLAHLCPACGESERSRWNTEKNQSSALSGPGRVYNIEDAQF